MPVHAATFPKADRVFARYVRDVLADVSASATQKELEHRIRAVYPRVVIRAREPLGGFGPEPVWYVYRDGRPVTQQAGRWWEQPSVAEATFLTGRGYTSANDAYCALHGMPPGSLTGRRWDEFATPDSIAEAAALWRRMLDDGWPDSGEPIQSTFTLVRADGRHQPVEYRTVPQSDGSFRTWQRALGEPEDPSGPVDEPTIRSTPARAG
jgi:PAS domain S-box-containing protein